MLSELFVFMNEQLRETLANVLQEKGEDYNEDVTIFYKESTEQRNKLKIELAKETAEESAYRLYQEYNIYNEISIAEKKLKNLLKLNPDNT